MSRDSVYQQLRGDLAALRLEAIADRLAPALEAAERDKPGYTQFLAELICSEVAADRERRLQTRMRFWNGPAVLVVDELGYLPMPAESASHLFQVINRRYENGSIVLTTNRGIADWGQIFEDTTVATAILDRLLHHATVLTIAGDSYRMRSHRDALKTTRAALSGS